jgi:hypothetical protein
MIITPLTIRLFNDTGCYFNLVIMAIKLKYSYGSLFSLDITEMYGHVELFYILRFYIYQR